MVEIFPKFTGGSFIAYDAFVKELHLGFKGTEINLWGPPHNMRGPRYYPGSGLSVCTCE